MIVYLVSTVRCLKMDVEPKYTFVALHENNFVETLNKNTQELFAKWGVNLSIKKYLFNEPFHHYHKLHLAEAFFKDQNVAKTLKTYQNHSWTPRGVGASSVEVKQIPCSITNMSFFDKLKNPENNVVHNSGIICKRSDIDIDGILVSDNLRGMLLDDESCEYFLYDDSEREEFIFRLFQMLVLGGELCQYEDELDPYLACTKNLYRDLIRVQMPQNSEELAVSTMVLEVSAKDDKDVAYFPSDPSHKRNIAFMLIDSDRRQITTLTHQCVGYFA